MTSMGQSRRITQVVDMSARPPIASIEPEDRIDEKGQLLTHAVQQNPAKRFISKGAG